MRSHAGASSARSSPLRSSRLSPGPARAQVQDTLPVKVSTLNHVSFGCADLPATAAWYEKVLGLPRHASQDYAGGQTVLRVGIDPPAYMALSQRGPESLNVPPTRRPHFCWGVPDFDLHRILAALAEMRAPARSVLREGTTINGVNFDAPPSTTPVRVPTGADDRHGGRVCDRRPAGTLGRPSS